MEDKNIYIDALKGRLDELEIVISQKKQQVRELLEEIKAREEQVEYILKLLAAEDITIGSNDIGNALPLSVSDMAYEVLGKQIESKPIHYRDLADMIMAEGKLIPGQDPAANLVAHLSRDSRFVRTGRGMYALAEWGLESAKKRSSRQRSKRSKR